MSKLILFQGDSITDENRIRERRADMGQGYAFMVAAQMGADYPDKYTFLNRGIGGDQIVDIYSRIKADIINFQPDYLSILVGVNDVLSEYRNRDGVSDKKYELIYDLMISELKEALPNLKIMVLEPFLLPGEATENTPEHPARWEYMRSEVMLRAAAKRIAKKYNLVFVPLQEMLDAVDAEHPGILTQEGVHPTAIGHYLIKEAWLEGFQKLV